MLLADRGGSQRHCGNREQAAKAKKLTRCFLQCKRKDAIMTAVKIREANE